MSQFKLIYFDGRGRAESIRMVFAASGTPFEDVRIQTQDWPKMKTNMPFGVLPVLEVRGHKFSQSGAILRYVASETGMTGKTSMEQVRLDGIADVITDIRETVAAATSEKDEKVKKQNLHKVYNNVKCMMEHLDSEAMKTSGDFFIGQKITYPDLHFYAVVESILSSKEDFLRPHKKLEVLYNKVAANTNVSNYLKNREMGDAPADGPRSSDKSSVDERREATKGLKKRR